MGMLEALTVTALGRSPYDEEPVTSQAGSVSEGVVETGQRYDDRGHPVNFETRKRMRDHIRASNEVMQAAGIIEETAAAKARDKAVEDSLTEETEAGLRRLELGRVILVGGVWGVCGLRRRILLYRSYSEFGLVDILRRERSDYSVMHIVWAGNPALITFQAIEWVGLLARALIAGPYKDPSVGTVVTRDERLKNYVKHAIQKTVNLSFTYVLLHYQLFAILQQLNLIPSDRLFPSLRSLIPFSAHSPLQISQSPWPLSLASLTSYGVDLVTTAAPFLLLFVHTRFTSIMSAIIYATVYRTLPRPVNPSESLMSALTDAVTDVRQALDELDSAVANRSRDTVPFSDTLNQENTGLDHIHRTRSSDDWDTVTTPPGDGPSQHTATLQALEGRTAIDNPAIIREDSSDDEDHDMNQTTLISFDVEANEISETSLGTWSAELRSANDQPGKSGEAVYHVTAYTMLPPLLVAEGISAVITSIIAEPLEAQVVRFIARAFRKSAHRGTADMFQVGLRTFQISWLGTANLVAVHAAEFVVTGAVWALYTLGLRWLDRSKKIWKKGEDGSLGLVDPLA